MQTVSSQQSNKRIAELAVLPVFFDLRGKRVVVIGGGEPAAWKTELLAAAGAQVDVYAEEVCEELSALASTSIILHPRPWTPDDLEGAALAIADIEDDAEAHAFIAAAKALAVPYNVIDRPEFCQFQFGAIVNRSPVVVGISTAGAAPILGQAVRRRIETLLPQTLTQWALLAAKLRGKVMDQLAAGPQRRAFWERLADRAFGSRAPDASDENINLPAASAAGRVTLVGAGPGDAELLTIKAVRALQSADVILFDDLVSSEVLELARREAKRMLVGKRAQRESCAQDEINAMMLSLARQGKHVVRLKSGDPMIFGRAGEEIEMLERHGVGVSVVPGISAGLALASRLGVSLTHRDHAQSVRFVTGHSRKGVLPDTLNWAALADPATTSVYYMSRRTLPGIVTELSARGMSLETPAIIAGSLGRADEQIWRGTIGEAVNAVEAFPLSAPTIFAVGDALSMKRAHVTSDPWNLSQYTDSIGIIHS
ncbi:uroporphyrin-III C-methyltransferase/precorrin-2 dehydrogenase/sirohydrochlorin ferrochelatase [Devosia subaequoris]|uniref:Uroporphyrin-III C-methyltransferase/precorrin-2 dehydrogenase/sirohydrochlorin ferrochelatase n=1 Tax=Devosia subaequoris TaxID=395930 RepID=A0A7W6IK96_9HYPH|nr:siroheme synthase CysG [Devosia subaequoris]MBB4051109.1 uroporphyrin-III C-methyltransferase/precorrin-2 dehydrogenase/sirohydrochlorin ferrochelatase [Devosia subaequoris]MCP1208225.1 siroheme synthase CysG [Devosia subaequoris]